MNIYDPDLSPEHSIRSDLWPTMTLTQLTVQQELVLEKIAKMHTFMGQNTTVSMQNIYGALHTALKELNALIDTKSTEK